MRAPDRVRLVISSTRYFSYDIAFATPPRKLPFGMILEPGLGKLLALRRAGHEAHARNERTLLGALRLRGHHADRENKSNHGWPSLLCASSA